MGQGRHRLPPLNALRAFEASARHLNFRLAAEELGVTQGAVAQHVRGLEADLAIKLFDRLPRTLALTGPGRSYAAQLRRAFDLMMQATAALRPEPLRLTISVSPTFASKWLIPRLPDFTTAHPEIELQILASESLSNFQSDGVDIAVRQASPPFAADLLVDLLFEQELVAVCSPRLLSHPPRPLQPEEVDRFTCSTTHTISGPSSSTEPWGAPHPRRRSDCGSVRPPSPWTPPSPDRGWRWQPAFSLSRTSRPRDWYRRLRRHCGGG
jgi:LysR family transcriptional regulator, glycine cleavage system transcriptional activator